MIARIWHGATAAAKADEYLTYINRTGVADYRATEDNQGVYVLRRIEGDEVHILTVSFWESMEKVKQFAGSDPETARYYPEHEAFLIGVDPSVKHYEVVAKP
jgi:heme-degrading monooxygenase HmoA